MYHFTDKDGFNAIRAAPTWLFRASQPPGNRPFGAYFTTLPPGTPRLATRLGIPRRKLEYVFSFTGGEDLIPLDGDRGEWVFYSRTDYAVVRERQLFHGEAANA
jgi:hypothetical protein